MMKQRFAAFDIDGTLFRSGLYREVAYELMKMEALPQEVFEETTAKNREWRHRIHGNAFEEFDMLVVDRVGHELPNLRIADYETAVAHVLEKKAENVYVYTRNLLQQLKGQGYFLIAISGSQVEIVEPFAKKYGFDAWVGQEWERGEEFFTGNTTKSHTDKDAILQHLIEEYGLAREESIAVGDSNGDVGMLTLADHAIAFNPTAELYEKALENKWNIVIERKNMMYELRSNPQGIFELQSGKHV